jgi:hypothetical protein
MSRFSGGFPMVTRLHWQQAQTQCAARNRQGPAGGHRGKERETMTQLTNSRHSNGTERPAMTLTILEIIVFAGLLAVHSLTGNATNDGRMFTSAMTGATLSAMHAAIPDDRNTAESSPTF